MSSSCRSHACFVPDRRRRTLGRPAMYLARNHLLSSLYFFHITWYCIEQQHWGSRAIGMFARLGLAALPARLAQCHSFSRSPSLVTRRSVTHLIHARSVLSFIGDLPLPWPPECQTAVTVPHQTFLPRRIHWYPHSTTASFSLSQTGLLRPCEQRRWIYSHLC